jgi:phospholipid/cholesterol/gamma-HCH transport system substrate-binding protein
VNFAIVGAFVVALAAAGIGAVLWFASGRGAERQHDTYLTYFAESVAGLNVRAPVKYRGVDVGQVKDIDLDPDDPGRVRLELAIRRGVPVKETTVATLGVQGLTGIAYVELGGASRESADLVARPGEPFPVIRSGPSLLRRLDTAATTLLADLDRIALSAQEVLDEPTRAALRSAAADLATVARGLAGQTEEIDRMIAATTRMMEGGARASTALPGLVDRLDGAARAIERMADELALAGTEARSVLGEVHGVTRDAAPDLRRLVHDLRETTSALGRVAGELERDPRLLVLGRGTPAPGPGG